MHRTPGLPTERGRRTHGARPPDRVQVEPLHAQPDFRWEHVIFTPLHISHIKRSFYMKINHKIYY